MKTIFKLSILFFSVALMAACEKNTPEEKPETFDFKIIDGMIHSPQWLIDEVNNHTNGEIYPCVYLVEYNGQEYIWIVDMMMAGTRTGGYFFFTSSGDIIAWDSDLWHELRYVAGPVGEEDILLWRYKYRLKNSKSISTRADYQTSFYTSNATLVPDTWIRDEFFTTPALIAWGKNYYDAEELVGNYVKF
jgi:hypothetical protein